MTKSWLPSTPTDASIVRIDSPEPSGSTGDLAVVGLG
jgi:hypothetical protein